MKLKYKPLKFVWRSIRNGISAIPFLRNIVFPQKGLASKFGRGDSQYAWKVFNHHFLPLQNIQAAEAKRILEIGPGQNLGTALLWWCHLNNCRSSEFSVTCWDVYQNAEPSQPEYWANLAETLISAASSNNEEFITNENILLTLKKVVAGELFPNINYQVCELSELLKLTSKKSLQFDLVYSHAAIEHVWNIEVFWEELATIVAEDGWYSHRIDLADHGDRYNNYIEMLEWSETAYWLTMRFIPGSTNRWRASHHLEKIEQTGFNFSDIKQERRNALPIQKSRINKAFRSLSDDDLRTTAIDVIAQKNPGR